MSVIENLEGDLINITKKAMHFLNPDEWDLPNCSHDDNTFDQPPARVFLRNLETHQAVLLSVATSLVLLVLLLAFIQWREIWNKVSIEKRQNKLYFLISLFPVSTLCCYVGMLAPRTALVLTSLGVLYFLTCMVVLISLIKHLFGGRKCFATTLAFDGKRISLQSPPFCCCMWFLPKPASSVKNLRLLEWFVLQAPIVRAIVVAFNVIAVAEFRDESPLFVHRSEFVAVGSLLLAIFGMHTMARLTTDKLRDYGFMTIFRIVDIALLFFTAQQPMLFENVLIRFKVFDCGPLMSAQDRARFICNFVIICEMTLLSLLATWRITPKRSALFDLHDKDQRLQLQMTDDSDLTDIHTEEFDA